MVNWRERIAIDPGVLGGKPVVEGTRLSVEFVVGLLAEGWTEQQLLASYRALATDDVRACLAYAAELVGDETTYPISA
jgi:uncharacterized protein (DUF433 family)